VDLGNVPAFDFDQSSSFTIDAWINSFGPTAQDGQFVVALNYQCSPTVQDLVIVNPGPDAGKVIFENRDANGIDVIVTSPAPLTRKTFHHVAGVREVIGDQKTL